MDFLEAVKDVGFPVAVAAYLLYERRRFHIALESKLSELIALLRESMK